MVLLVSGMVWAASPTRNALPLFFVPNLGQAPPHVLFMAQGSGLTAYFLSNGATFRMGRSLVNVSFPGANPSVAPESLGQMPAHANFLIGKAADWHVGVPLYSEIAYRQIYPGIDMVFGGSERNLKSEFRVAPGADPSRVGIRYTGAGEPRIENGTLVIPVGGYELREQVPLAYQERAGRRIPIHCRFMLSPDGTVGFTTGEYDRSLPLVIDPVLSYSTLLGGSGFDSATGVAVDSMGEAYVAGFTDSYDFPTANPAQNYNAGSTDGFVAKLNASGNGLVYCTYLGGSGDDRAYGIAVDGTGAAYIAGSTTSTNFPVSHPYQSRLAGGRDAFIAKLNPAGNALVYSTYLGGGGMDVANGIAVDAGGYAYVVGDTNSINFPASGIERSPRGGQDAFVAKLAIDGSRLVYSTYLGGSNDDHGAAIAVDSASTVYLTGSTWSTDFPVVNAFQPKLAGSEDAFVARLSADGNTLLFATYLGGTGGTASYPETGQAIALDGQGSAYIAGTTSSANFPVLLPVQASLRGFLDAFVSKLSSSGVLLYSTYLGGSSVDYGNAIAVDAGGNAYVAGYSYSTDLAVVGALQQSNAGECDGFIAQLGPAGDTLEYLTYWGGNGGDTISALALDSAGGLYAAGYTLSSNFPLLNAYQSINTGNYGAFVTKQVFASALSNLALGKTATQSSDNASTTVAALAVDGNTNGNFSAGSVTATLSDANAWWQVDLGSTATLTSIVVWNRTDCCWDRLADYWVFVSNTPFGPTDTPSTLQSRTATWSNHQTTMPIPSTAIAAAGAQGRYVRVQLTGTNVLSLAEVQVIGTAGTLPTYSISGQVVVTGTGTGLSGVTVALSGGTSASTTTAASGNYSFSGLPAGGNYTVTPSITGYTFTPASQSFSSLGASQTQNFSAAVVLVGSNLAAGKTATQSSDYGPTTGAALAVDGNTNGNFSAGSVTATLSGANPWWQVDLGSSATVTSIVIWNRTDCCWDRLADYWVFVSNTPFGPTDTPSTLQSRTATWSSHQTTMPTPSTTIAVGGAQGRYVRVQLTSANVLSLAEVQIF